LHISKTLRAGKLMAGGSNALITTVFVYRNLSFTKNSLNKNSFNNSDIG